MIFAFERANLKKKSWILVDQSDIWTPKCTEGGGSPNYEISLNFNNFLVASFRRLEKKNGYLTVRLTESKGGVSLLNPDRK